MIQDNTEVVYLNTNDFCIVCFKKPEKWENGQDIALIKHHVSYYPQIVAYVHFNCHEKIHDPKNPITHLIQYEREDSIRFYKEKAEKEKKIEP